MRGVNSSVDSLLDDSNSYGLSNQLVEDVIEQLRTQAFPEIVKGDMRRSVEEVKAAYKLKPDIELQLFSQIPLSIAFSSSKKKKANSSPIGSTTMAVTLSENCWKLLWVLMSVGDMNTPNPRWEWYQPTILPPSSPVRIRSDIFAMAEGGLTVGCRRKGETHHQHQ